MENRARKHVGTLRRLFEKIQNRIDIAAWNSWHHLLTHLTHGLINRPYFLTPASRSDLPE